MQSLMTRVYGKLYAMPEVGNGVNLSAQVTLTLNEDCSKSNQRAYNNRSMTTTKVWVILMTKVPQETASRIPGLLHFP